MANILIIEDEDGLRATMCAVLRNAGHNVQEAADGNAGLKCFKESSPDIVITDIVMPGKEGIETIVEVRRLAPKVKIIAMSGGGRSSPKDYLKMARTLGASQTLSKPFWSEDLLASVKNLVGSQSLQ